MPNIENRDEDLLARIRTAVREHTLESEVAAEVYPLQDMTVDFIEEDIDGTRRYEVYGDTTALVYGPKRAPDDWDEYEVDCSVNLEVSIDTDGGIDVETKEVMLHGDAPWDLDEWDIREDEFMGSRFEEDD